MIHLILSSSLFDETNVNSTKTQSFITRCVEWVISLQRVKQINLLLNWSVTCLSLQTVYLIRQPLYCLCFHIFRQSHILHSPTWQSYLISFWGNFILTSLKYLRIFHSKECINWHLIYSLPIANDVSKMSANLYYNTVIVCIIEILKVYLSIQVSHISVNWAWYLHSV